MGKEGRHRSRSLSLRVAPLAGAAPVLPSRRRRTRRRRSTRSAVSSSSRTWASRSGPISPASAALAASSDSLRRRARVAMSSSCPGSATAPGSSASRACSPTRSCSAASRRAAGVEVRTGAQQQGLAGVDPLLAPQHRGESLLRPQLLGAPPPARGAARPDVHLAGRGMAPGGDLLAAAVADADGDRALRCQFGQAGVGARCRLRVQGPVQHARSPPRPGRRPCPRPRSPRAASDPPPPRSRSARRPARRLPARAAPPPARRRPRPRAAVAGVAAASVAKSEAFPRRARSALPARLGPDNGRRRRRGCRRGRTA